MTAVRRYAYPFVLGFGAALMVLGFALRPHHRWLFDIGLLSIFSALAVRTTIVRRELLVLLPRLQILCEDAGVQFRAEDLGCNWRFPLAVVTLWLAVCSQIVVLIFKAGDTPTHPIHLASDVIGLVAIASLFLTFVVTRRISSAVLELSPVERTGEPVSAPPKAATFILLLIPKRHREYLIGDMEEEYARIVLPQYGSARAKLWYWWHVVISIWPFLWVFVKRIVTIAAIWTRLR